VLLLEQFVTFKYILITIEDISTNLISLKNSLEPGQVAKFCDTTPSYSRRWCDMSTCGNKAKARRHYERVRQKRIAAAWKDRPRAQALGRLFIYTWHFGQK
jgi:hypothetical protein